jgi:DNA uptake protein ComE-like DNA-binding protein
MRTATKGALVLAAILAWGLAIAPTPALAAKADKIDINSASQADLESLPGVGAATAKKIIAGRPFSSVSDLSRVGVSADTIAKIKPLVKAGRGSAPAAETAKTEKPAAKAAKEEKAAKPAEEKAVKAATEAKMAPASALSGAKVDLNTASEKELEALPAVGAATAKKIIAGRPYSSAADLAKAGVSAKTIETISPLVTVSQKAAPLAAPASKPAPAAAKSAPPASVASSPAQPPPSKGMVWVNTETKVFHREGDKWYGNTKQGKYMTEADALKAGYRESKEHMKKQ